MVPFAIYGNFVRRDKILTVSVRVTDVGSELRDLLGLRKVSYAPPQGRTAWRSAGHAFTHVCIHSHMRAKCDVYVYCISLNCVHI
jgi:hypothetical protein